MDGQDPETISSSFTKNEPIMRKMHSLEITCKSRKESKSSYSVSHLSSAKGNKNSNLKGANIPFTGNEFSGCSGSMVGSSPPLSPTYYSEPNYNTNTNRGYGEVDLGTYSRESPSRHNYTVNAGSCMNMNRVYYINNPHVVSTKTFSHQSGSKNSYTVNNFLVSDYAAGYQNLPGRYPVCYGSSSPGSISSTSPICSHFSLAKRDCKHRFPMPMMSSYANIRNSNPMSFTSGSGFNVPLSSTSMRQNTRMNPNLLYDEYHGHGQHPMPMTNVQIPSMCDTFMLKDMYAYKTYNYIHNNLIRKDEDPRGLHRNDLSPEVPNIDHKEDSYGEKKRRKGVPLSYRHLEKVRRPKLWGPKIYFRGIKLDSDQMEQVKLNFVRKVKEDTGRNGRRSTLSIIDYRLGYIHPLCKPYLFFSQIDHKTLVRWLCKISNGFRLHINLDYHHLVFLCELLIVYINQERSTITRLLSLIEKLTFLMNRRLFLDEGLICGKDLENDSESEKHDKEIMVKLYSMLCNNIFYRERSIKLYRGFRSSMLHIIKSTTGLSRSLKKYRSSMSLKKTKMVSEKVMRDVDNGTPNRNPKISENMLVADEVLDSC